MSISMKELFSRQNIESEVISLRNSLSNHPQGLNMGLREAHERLLQPADGDGFARGCRRPDSVEIGVPVFGGKELGGVLPSWMPIAGNTRLVRDHGSGETTVRLEPDYRGETRAVEGILEKSRIAYEDFPFKSWHTYYDWQFYVRVDKQYTYLLSESNINDFDGIFECEWDTGDPDGEGFLPKWAWPQRGDRVWIVGRWIYDCGHPDDEDKHRAEIHPPKAVASFREEPMEFPENDGPVRANTAVLYIGRDGGYWRQPINDQNYAFDLYLPPKPYEEAEPVWRVNPETGQLPVQPKITPYPAGAPKALRVIIPLEGVEPHPAEYGAGIAGGWSDPRGTESAKIKRFRVTIEKIFMDANLDPPFQEDEWYIYIGINGRWKIWQDLGGDSEKLDYSVELDLHPEDRIHITASGFEADEINSLTGKSIGLSWAQIQDPQQLKNNAEKIKDGFESLGLSLDPGINNEKLSTLSVKHLPQARPSDTVVADGEDYRLRYRIEEL